MLSTAAISLVPEYDAVIGRAHEVLAPGGRIAIFDFDEPGWAPDWFVRLMVGLVRPFGGTLDVVRERDPAGAVARHVPVHARTDVYGGFAYVVAGRRKPGRGGAMHWMDGWHGAWMWLVWIVVLGIGLAIVIALVRAVGAGGPRAESPEEILRRRYAHGEIDRDELEERLEELRRSG